MKKIFLLVAIIAAVFVQTGFAQQHPIAEQEAVITSYYNIKDALVTGNAGIAAASAEKLVKALNSADVKTIGKDEQSSLMEQAGKIAETKDLKKQREYFAVLSTDMIALAKGSKLSAAPIYQMYCPMKKSNWLSSEQTVKNPYYGSSMLSCGKVVSTLK